ncbi:hypothetical protein PRIPAC_88784 [Pristionchus pacificus]|uniref:Protein kinase domain-containing protein n=1 Tax=Pristionchus pacificus TaxID=54126 RepID=A0A2A6CVV1_PRIPA|nr:hypothetical protein PRIPAC_88784 [Pristionchus pacificus]|eukprot:PDM82258.1 protein kinase [Pristionchus pacificus]
MTNSECVESTWRHQLPANTSCYQLEDGTFFLFNEVPPYALCAVVKGRRVDVALPALKEPLFCSGVLGNGLYFYSSPPRRRSFKFYRASVNQDAVEFMKIREHLKILYRLREGISVAVEQEKYYSSYTVSKPPKTCYSSSTSNLLVPSKSTPRILPKSATTIPKSAGIAKQQVSNGSSTTFESSFLKNFKPLKVLGHGSFGWVFEVERNLEGIVKWNRAVKHIALRGSPNAINNVLKEVEAMEKLDHPGIVSFHNAWTEQPPSGWQRESDSILLSNLGYGGCIPHYYDDCSFLYIEMELCQSTLSTWIADNNVRNMSKIKLWFRQIVSAVGYIHSRGKIHRDLKPCNILITNENVLKICDLGLITDCQIESGLDKNPH